MKLTRGKKTALIIFGIFLVFMGICTVVAKGIYASGLPRVNTMKPYSGSLTHEIAAAATVKQGQEYGIYAEAGLMVDTVSVSSGDYFEPGDALFRIELEDLREKIAQLRLEIAKLEVQRAEAVKAGGHDRKEQQSDVARAREDYDKIAEAADARIARCLQELEAAQRELALYDQYLAESEAADKEDTEKPGEGEIGPGFGIGNGGSIGGAPEGWPGDSRESGGEPEEEPEGHQESGEPQEGNAEGARGENTGLTEVVSQVPDYEQNYTRQEKRLQLEQRVTACALALEEAELQKERELLAAVRLIEDAEGVPDPDASTVNLLSLDMEYQKGKLERLETLLETEGWVYAEFPGRVVECRLTAGERVQDSAGILYALADGEQMMTAVFTEEQLEYVSLGTRFEAEALKPDGSKATGAALVEDLTAGEGKSSYARLSFEGLDLEIGQSVQLSGRFQTESYAACVPVSCLYQEGENIYYIFIVEEGEGILGTEWKVRKVSVTVLDRTDTTVAIQSVNISSETRIVSGTTKALTEGVTVRVVQ